MKQPKWNILPKFFNGYSKGKILDCVCENCLRESYDKKIRRTV